jgi:hypothetical protein
VTAKRWTKANPCVICNGSPELPPGQGRRCFGMLSEDGAYARCTRDELAGAIERNSDLTYSHRIAGACKCGTTHGAPSVVDIADAARAIVATYDYTNASGALLFQVVRMHPKTFRQRKPDGRGGWTWKLDGLEPVLYRLPDVRAGVAAGDTIYVAEGEKDVEALREAGCVATCNAGGAGKWRDRYSKELAGANVVIVRDKDEVGTDHARKVFASVKPHAASIRVVEARAGKDAADHLEHHGVADFVPVWPAADLRETDPVAWKRRALRMGMDVRDPMREVAIDAALARPNAPKWPTGLEGAGDLLPNLHGVVIAAGVPSSGKSYFAIASAVDAARFGWDVIYLSCEMSDQTIAARIKAAANGEVPETFRLVNVSFGASVETLIALIEQRVTERNTLIVFDSVSSFCDQIERKDGEDVYGVDLLKRLIMWAINVRVETEGQVSFIMLAEASKEGRMRGRSGDHKADRALLFESDPAHPQSKKITVTKSWESLTGSLGYFHLDFRAARLVRL